MRGGQLPKTVKVWNYSICNVLLDPTPTFISIWRRTRSTRKLNINTMTIVMKPYPMMVSSNRPINSDPFNAQGPGPDKWNVNLNQLGRSGRDQAPHVAWLSAYLSLPPPKSCTSFLKDCSRWICQTTNTGGTPSGETIIWRSEKMAFSYP